MLRGDPQRQVARERDRDRAVRVRKENGRLQGWLGVGRRGDPVIDESDVGSLRRGVEHDGVAGFGAGFGKEIDDVVVDHDGGHDDFGAVFTRAIRKERCVNEYAAFDFANALGGDVFGELLDDEERITWQSGTLVGVVLIDKGEGAVGLDAIRKIGISAGDENEIALQLPFRIDRTRAIDAGMKTVVRAQFGEERAFGKDFRGGGGHEEFIGVERVDDFAGIERIELDAEINVSEFGAADDTLYALGQRGFGLRTRLRDWEKE